MNWLLRLLRPTAVVHVVEAVVPLTQTLLDDADDFQEMLTVASVMNVHPRPRYRFVWAEGYMAALADVKSGRLVIADGDFRLGDAGAMLLFGPTDEAVSPDGGNAGPGMGSERSDR